VGPLPVVKNKAFVLPGFEQTACAAKQTFRPQQVLSEQIWPAGQSELAAVSEHPCSGLQLVPPLTQNPLPLPVTAHTHTETEGLHSAKPLHGTVEPEQEVVAHAPFWQMPDEHCSHFSLCRFGRG
jgi:hypothetical protein